MQFILENVKILKIHTKEANLEEVFLKLTILSKFDFLK